MPLSKAGKEAMSKMKTTYGAKKGTQVFYALENKSEKFAKAVKKGGK